MTKCPWCFTTVPTDSAAFICAASCPPEKDEVKARWSGKAGSTSKPLTIAVGDSGNKKWRPPETKACRKCKGATQPCCSTCHFAFPPNWRTGQAVTVAFAGARAAGKTVFIGVMVHFLELAMQARGRAFGFGDEASRLDYRQNYESVIFEALSLPSATGLAATQPNFQPMVLTLGEKPVADGRTDGVPRYLVVRDVAGEELENNGPTDHLAFFANADLVVFLFDPLRVEEIRAQVSERIAQRQLVGGDPVSVLSRVLTLMGQGGRIAVTMSKFDIMHQLANIQGSRYQQTMSNNGAAMLQDNGPTAPVNDAQQRLLDAEIRSLLTVAHAANLVNTVTAAEQRGTRSRFFAVSALGNAPNADGLHPHGIAPFRVLDPVMWMMSETGVV